MISIYEATRERVLRWSGITVGRTHSGAHLRKPFRSIIAHCALRGHAARRFTSVIASAAPMATPLNLKHSSAWLASTSTDTVSTGTCGWVHTAGDCEADNQGSVRLPADSFASWEMAAAACIAVCTACSRCRYISLSLKHRDCSWFTTCIEHIYNPDWRTMWLPPLLLPPPPPSPPPHAELHIVNPIDILGNALVDSNYSTVLYDAPLRMPVDRLQVVYLGLLPDEVLRRINLAGGVCRHHAKFPLPPFFAPLHRHTDPEDAMWIRRNTFHSYASTEPNNSWVEVTHCGTQTPKASTHAGGTKIEGRASYHTMGAWFYVAHGSGVSLNVGRSIMLGFSSATKLLTHLYNNTRGTCGPRGEPLWYSRATSEEAWREVGPRAPENFAPGLDSVQITGHHVRARSSPPPASRTTRELRHTPWSSAPWLCARDLSLIAATRLWLCRAPVPAHAGVLLSGAASRGCAPPHARVRDAQQMGRARPCRPRPTCEMRPATVAATVQGDERRLRADASLPQLVHRAALGGAERATTREIQGVHR